MSAQKKVEALENLKESIYQMRMWSATVLDEVDKELVKLNNKS